MVKYEREFAVTSVLVRKCPFSLSFFFCFGLGWDGVGVEAVDMVEREDFDIILSRVKENIKFKIVRAGI